MKKIISCFLISLILCTSFSGCKQADSMPQEAAADTMQEPAVGTTTAFEALEDLFTTVDLMDATIAELQTEMEAGHVTSEQLTQMYIDRIEAYDRKRNLNSIITVNPNALNEARELDQERESGNVRGPLHGIPIVVKANIEIAGMATSAGSNALADMVATEDAFVVKQLKDAGAVILAQTNMSEFACSAYSSQSTLGGNVHNAYDTTKSPAGSSGGTAVAVTCNFAAAGIGTDTGGSIRNPASFSNLYSIRPSKGLTSIGGVLPLKAYKDTTAPMARTAQDMALLLEIMAGTDEEDDYTVEADADTLSGDGYINSLSADSLKGMRIGYLEFSFSYSGMIEEEYVYQAPDKKVEAMYHRTIADLRKAGAEMVNMTDTLSSEMIETLSEGIDTEPFEYDINRYLFEKGEAAPYKTVGELFNSGTGGIMFMNLGWLLAGQYEYADSFEETKNPYSKTIGSYQRIPEWEKVLDGREQVAAILEENDIDAVMYMNFFDVARSEDAVVNETYNRAGYDVIFGPKLGLPEISLPMGFSDTNSEYTTSMPLGLSIFSAFGQEKTLLQLAYAFEQQAGDFIRKMPEQTPALEDKTLNAFLLDLIDKAYSIDYSQYSNKPEGKVQIMLNACEKAMNVDTKDPCATYEAARTLAEAYDNVLNELKK